VAGIDFGTDELLEQARGNQSAIWHLAIRRAREQEESVEGWASYIGEDFAPSWDEMGENASALDVARGAAMNIATTADMRPIALDGDRDRAVLTIEGPESDWTDAMGTSVEDLDRANEIVFSTIARRRGLTLTQEREGGTFRLTFERAP
jgi:hypothetical protein